ncbi:MAG: hypothetical protein PSX36_13510 [bacterium]|nr:hypothetical protein [bacterium]
METPANSQFSDAMSTEPERPQFLKILCILSFVGCGLMILLYSIGSMSLGLNEQMISSFWAKAIESNPQLEDLDPVVFFHEFGMVCVYGLIATIFSLIGVIMMWRLEKIGFFIYAIAELSTNFFSMNMGNAQDKSYAGTIFAVIIDLVFIVLYFQNLKHMNKKNNNTFIQSGT